MPFRTWLNGCKKSSKSTRFGHRLVGAGNLGKAIGQYQGFTNRGFRVVMIFDNDPAVIGTQVGKFVVQSSAGMVQAIRQAGLKIAMLTVPASRLKKVAETLSKQACRRSSITHPWRLICLPQSSSYIDRFCSFNI